MQRRGVVWCGCCKVVLGGAKVGRGEGACGSLGGVALLSRLGKAVARRRKSSLMLKPAKVEVGVRVGVKGGVRVRARARARGGTGRGRRPKVQASRGGHGFRVKTVRKSTRLMAGSLCHARAAHSLRRSYGHRREGGKRPSGRWAGWGGVGWGGGLGSCQRARAALLRRGLNEQDVLSVSVE